MDVIVYTIPNLARLTIACNQDVARTVSDYDKRFHGAKYLVRYAGSHDGRLSIGYEDSKTHSYQPIHIESNVKPGEPICRLPVVFEQLTYFFDIDFEEAVDGLDESSIRIKHYLNEFTESFNRRGRSIRGQFSFVNEPGRFRIEVTYKTGSIERSIWFDFTVASTKMDVLNDYRTILRAVEDWDRSLVFSAKAKALHDVQKKEAKASPDDIKNWVVYFEKSLDVYEQALRRILHEPNKQMVSTEFYHRADQVKRWTPSMAREYARYMNDPAKLERHRFVDTIREMTFDTRENRFVKHTLIKLTQFLQLAFAEFSADKDYSQDFKDGLDSRIARFKRYARSPKFINVPMQAKAVNSLVMQMRPGYSDIRIVWGLMNSLFTTDLTLSSRHNPAVGFSKLSALYEFWCFITVKELMDDIMKVKFGISGIALSATDAQKAIEVANTAEDIPSATPIAYAYKDSLGATIAEVAFQQSYGPHAASDVFAAPFQQRPDIVVRLQDKAHIYTYLFDAKYQIENSPYTANREAAPRSALDQMHRYRDAILWRKNDGSAASSDSIKREVVGAYILYPADIGKADNVPIYSYDSLISEQNIGAFALLPKRVRGLHDFLLTLVEKLDINAKTSGWLLKEKQVIPQKGLFYTDQAESAIGESQTLRLEMTNNLDLAGLKSKGRFPVLKSVADKAGLIKRIVITSSGKPICSLNGELLIGTSNPSSFFAEFGNDWVQRNVGQLFSTFRIS